MSSSNITKCKDQIVNLFVTHFIDSFLLVPHLSKFSLSFFTPCSQMNLNLCPSIRVTPVGDRRYSLVLQRFNYDFGITECEVKYSELNGDLPCLSVVFLIFWENNFGIFLNILIVPHFRRFICGSYIVILFCIVLMKLIKLNSFNSLLSMVTVAMKMIPLSTVAAFQLVDQNPCFNENSCLCSQGNIRYWHAPSKQHSVQF